MKNQHLGARAEPSWRAGAKKSRREYGLTGVLFGSCALVDMTNPALGLFWVEYWLARGLRGRTELIGKPWCLLRPHK